MQSSPSRSHTHFFRAPLTSRCAALKCFSLCRGNFLSVTCSCHEGFEGNAIRRPDARCARKVRDIYDLDDKLLIVATDRLSAFDVILPTPIPDKGRVLTQLSLFWFRLLKDVIPNHVLSATDFPPPFAKFKDELAGRSMVVQKTQPLPIECVVRGYVSGSGWKDYRTTGEICGIPLPAGLRESDRLPEPIFTPATKAATGHDEISLSNALHR